METPCLSPPCPMSERSTPFVIAIDGPVAAGKDTVARLVAKQLGTLHLNSGALYRMWTLLTQDLALEDLPSHVPHLVDVHSFRLERRPTEVRYFLDDEDVTEKLHDNTISLRVSQVSRIPSIRAHVNARIRQFAGTGSLVIDGRDATTIIFPDADLKVYLDTAFDVRVGRRLTQLQAKGERITFATLAAQMAERDANDRAKGIYSLTRSEDAFYLDATDLSPESAAARIVQELQAKIRYS